MVSGALGTLEDRGVTISDNPKDRIGRMKVAMHSVPCRPLLEIGLAMMEGAIKYGDHNYRSAGIRASVYYDAAIRHLMAWWEGEDTDPDSGLPHLAKAMACLVVLRDGEIMGNRIDDRPITVPEGAGISELNRMSATLIERVTREQEKKRARTK
jgi:hypothetical protein